MKKLPKYLQLELFILWRSKYLAGTVATWHSYFLFFLECSNLRILVFGPLLPLDKKVMFWSLVCETIKKNKVLKFGSVKTSFFKLL
jgi:hypothetical protein